MKRVARIGGAAVLAAALFVAGGVGLFRANGEGAKAQTPGASSADTLLAPAISGSLEQIIGNLQSRLRVLPTDWQAFASLGLAYVQQARVTADPSYYPKAQGVLERSLGLERNDNFAAMVVWPRSPRRGTTSPARCGGVSRPRRSTRTTATSTA
ncbi:MAG: hypothetical protein ACXVWF_10265 [Actinomycetota bacterium]